LKTLYPEQTEARYKSNSLLNAGISHVYVSPCGTGKTVTSSFIVLDRIKLGHIVYILCPQIEIFTQWIDELVEVGIDPGYINDEGIRGADRKVYVCMYQSLVNLLPMIPESLFPTEIIIDETQHLLSNSIKTICTFFGNATLLGLTATLYHGSGETFKPWFTDSFQTITKKQAIEKGYITKSIAIVPEEFLKDAKIPMVGDDYDMNKQAALLGTTRIIGDVIKYYELLFCGNPVIVPCATFNHSKQMTEMFNNAGWHFEHLHSELPKHERKRILRAVANQEINGICTVGIGVEGLSIKGLWGVMWLCRTMSPIKWTQFDGRPERLFPGKKYSFIVDFVGNVIIHGLPENEFHGTLDGKEKDPEETTAKMITCPSCGVYNSTENLICHWCGYDLTFIPLDGTCGKCKHHKKNLLTATIFCDELGDTEKYTNIPGCPLFQKKGRMLPAMIDGELVAITTDGQIHSIKERVRKRKEEQSVRIQEKEEHRQSLEEISEAEKRKVLKDGMFKDGGRRLLFKEALEGMR